MCRLTVIAALVALGLALSVPPAQADDCPPGTIITVMGGGVGDGYPARDADIDNPIGLALAPDGSLYFADKFHHRVRKIDPDGIIHTVAGDGWTDNERWGRFGGDGGPATQASLNFPLDIALAPDGTLYIADLYNHRVRQVTPDGLISAFAGDGWSDAEHHGRYTGDGGPAVKASLNGPFDVAVGPDGLVYIADTYNHRIRRVGPDGIIETIAGDGWHDKEGNGRFAGDGGPAIKASLNAPIGLEFGPDGSLYLCDDYSRVRRIEAGATGVGADSVITAVAGNGKEKFLGDGGPAAKASLSEPNGLAFGPDGSLYISDLENERVRKVQAVNGRVGCTSVITTIAGGGRRHEYSDEDDLALNTVFSKLGDVVVAPDGTIYVSDWERNRIRKIYMPENNVIRKLRVTTIAGGREGYAGDGGPASLASIERVGSIAIGPNGSVFVADTTNDRVRRIGPDGIVHTVAGSGAMSHGGRYDDDSALAINTDLDLINALAVGPDGSLYIAQGYMWDGQVLKVSWPEGHGITEGIIALAAGGATEGFAGDGGPATAAAVNEPGGLAVGPDGALYIADSGNHRIRRVDRAGIITTIAGNGATEEKHGRSGSPYHVGVFAGDGGAAIEASFEGPWALAFGPDGSLYADDGDRVRKIQAVDGVIGPDSLITTIAGDGWRKTVTRKFADSEETYEVKVGRFRGDGGPAVKASIYGVSGIAVADDGSVLVADGGNNRVRMINSDGIITTVAGNGDYGFSGDGGPATEASLRGPGHIALGPDGSLYVADSLNRRIRKVCRITKVGR